MNNYVKPSLAKYGNSLECIEGSCGFGFENIWLDKTGATKTSIRKWVLVSRITLLVGPWIEQYECKYVDGCSTESHQC